MILGITGISGSGKHTAADFFAQRGWKILDTDKIAHNLYRPYTHLWKLVKDHFGEGILGKDDKIDRQKLGAIVFGDKTGEKIEELNRLTHPEVLRFLENEVHSLNRKNRNAVILGALWKELGMKEVCHKILLIKAGEALTFERIKKRDGVNFDLYEMRIKNQTEIPDPDFTIENEADFQAFYKGLNEIIKTI